MVCDQTSILYNHHVQPQPHDMQETMIWEVDETLSSQISWDEFSLCYRWKLSRYNVVCYTLVSCNLLPLLHSQAGTVRQDRA
jgi:hypothetical protein